MNERPVTDAMAREFLLGQLDVLERERIERLYLSDSQVKEKISVVEDELIDQFLDGELSPADRERFLAQYAATPRQRRKLRIVRSIKEHAFAEANVNQTRPASAPRMHFFGRWLRNPTVSIGVAAAIIAIIGAIWLIRLSVQRTQESNRHVKIEREIAELNRPSERHENAQQVLSATLKPGSVRVIERENALKPTVESNIIDLKLLWTQTEKYPSYQATVRRRGDREAFTIGDLHLETDRNGTSVRLLLPAHLLTNGLYQISLSGVPGSGVPAFPEEYNFTIQR